MAARAANSKEQALAVANETAANQIFSYPVFVIRNEGFACNTDTTPATCTVSAEGKDLSMIFKVSGSARSGWKVTQIEPVID